MFETNKSNSWIISGFSIKPSNTSRIPYLISLMVGSSLLLDVKLQMVLKHGCDNSTWLLCLLSLDIKILMMSVENMFEISSSSVSSAKRCKVS